MREREKEREKETFKKKEVTLTKSGLKSLLGEAEGGGWRRWRGGGGIKRRRGRVHQTTTMTATALVVEITAATMTEH